MMKFLQKINWRNATGTVILGVIVYLLTDGVPKFWETTFASVIGILMYEVRLYAIILIVLVLLLLRLLGSLFTRDTILDQPVGQYTYGQLMLILSKIQFDVNDYICVQDDKIAPDNLFGLFMYYYEWLHAGVEDCENNEEAKFVAQYLGPKFCTYELVTKNSVMDRRFNFTGTRYEVSELGTKFYSLYQKNSIGAFK